MPRRFDFVSPGIQLTEIDQSTIPEELVGDGPLIIGLASRGPANKPVRITSKENFRAVFGDPIYGPISSELYPDSWRNGSKAFPQYGAIAADAWLSADESPITFIRLLGEQSAQALSDGKAGWNTAKNPTTAIGTNGGSYGLFIINSGSSEDIGTGTLAAIWYLQEGKIELSGTAADPFKGANSKDAGVLYESIGGGAKNTFKAVISDASGAEEVYTFDLDPESENHIRKVFNTEPYKVSSITETDTETYWLGETFEESVDRFVTNTAAGQQYGIILGLGSGSNFYNDHEASFLPSKTGWFINRDPDSAPAAYDSTQMERLFKLVSLHDGEQFEKNYYVEIADLKLGTIQNPKSTFTVNIKSWSGGIVETYSNLNLDPGDSDFIGRRIGTQYRVWDNTDKKYNTKGRYPNLSDYVYVELSEALETGAGTADPYALPFGFYGPNKFKGFTIKSGSTETFAFGSAAAPDAPDFPAAFVLGSGSIVSTALTGFQTAFALLGSATDALTASFVFPDIKLTTSQSFGPGQTDYPVNSSLVFGINHKLKTKGLRDQSYVDLVRALPTNYDVHAIPLSTDNFERSFIFTLDEIVYNANPGTACYTSGSRAAGNSYTATNDTQALIDLNFKGFRAPFFGGKDGLDITEKDPFREGAIGSTLTNSYEFNTLQKVLDIARDPENVDMDIVSIPGQRDDTILDDLIAVADERQDCLAIIDPPSSYTTTGDDSTEAAGTVRDVVSSVRGRNYNSSYAAAYYPWLLLNNTEGGANVYVPPSIGAIGAIASSQKATEPWFAPAGFNRGGLSSLGGPSGPQVIGTAETLNKSNRDKLYETNVNPIAKFGDNVVIFGQKTLQATPSALDRINVRRLMIYLKKQIGLISETILFDQNINTTWRRFTAAASAVLNDIQAGGGITEYKLILDSSTTTPDLQDRNILYAKVLVKPARAIEFIAVDFVITRSGVQF